MACKSFASFAFTCLLELTLLSFRELLGRGGSTVLSVSFCAAARCDSFANCKEFRTDCDVIELLSDINDLRFSARF